MTMSREPEPTYGTGRDHLRDELVRVDLLVRRWLFGGPTGGSEGDANRRVPTGLFLSDGDVDRLLLTRSDALARVRSKSGEGVAEESDAGPIGPGPVESISHGSARTESTSPSLEAVTRTVRRRAHRSVEVGVELRLCSLAASLDLTPLEFDVLVCVLAPEVDPVYGAVYGYLRDDLTATRPTVDLIARLLAGDGSARLACYDPFTSRSALVRDGFVTVEGRGPLPGRTVRVADRVVAHLLGHDAVAEEIDDDVLVREPGEGRLGTLVDPERREAIDALVDAIRDRSAPRAPEWMGVAGEYGEIEACEESDDLGGSDDLGESDGNDPAGGADPDGVPPFAAFFGPDERTAEAAVDRVGALADLPIVRYDIGAPTPVDHRARIAAVRREARLRGALVHVMGLETFASTAPASGETTSVASTASDATRTSEHDRRRRSSKEALGWLFAELDRFPGPVVCSGDVDLDPSVASRLDRHRFTSTSFPRPDVTRRRAAWESVGDLPPDVDPAALADAHRLTVGEIEDAAAGARAAGDGSMTAETLRLACRRRSRGNLGELAREIEPAYGWDDVVLPADRLAHLREVAGAIRRRGTVFEEWGFADRFGRGNGVTVLLTGKPGTGKTMAAEVIAADVGLPLYGIDLSGVLSKYIGETERNLGRAFDAAEEGDCILFFDEADALFGTRTEISDAHDRYANVEVDYLLQRLDEHDGCVILASNLKENIDEAFRRRIDAAVSFPMPDEAARREIWSRIFPAETPTDGIDPAFLAGFELSGGYIKNVATTAAFLAAADDDPVGMGHLVRALRREFQKTGRLYDVESFGPYREAFE